MSWELCLMRCTLLNRMRANPNCALMKFEKYYFYLTKNWNWNTARLFISVLLSPRTERAQLQNIIVTIMNHIGIQFFQYADTCSWNGKKAHYTYCDVHKKNYMCDTQNTTQRENIISSSTLWLTTVSKMSRVSVQLRLCSGQVGSLFTAGYYFLLKLQLWSE